MSDGPIDSLLGSVLRGSFFLGGFECSNQRRRDGTRLDLMQSTGHLAQCEQDYRLLGQAGIGGARDGFRWPAIEKRPGRYDWSGMRPLVQAARRHDAGVIWDLCHYGWPGWIDIWSASFVARFAAFAASAALFLQEEAPDRPRWFCPINEISFWAWAGGDVEQMNPFARGRGGELKRQLVRASLAAIAAIRAVDPDARFISAEPLINVAPAGDSDEAAAAAEGYRLSQFEATDLLLGRIEPELGGHRDAIDAIGVNFYPHNQWELGGTTIPLGHHRYRPLSMMLAEVHARYGKPMLLTETGAEGSARAAWLHYVCDEVREAQVRGVPMGGICLYPVLDYPGWENDRPCPVGLFGPPGAGGARPVHQPLLQELQRQQALFGAPARGGKQPEINPGIKAA